LVGGWVQAGRLSQLGTRPAPAAVDAILRRLSEELRLARLPLLRESEAVQVPAVVGWLRPVVLLPTSAIGGLAQRQLDVLLAHELVHVRRHDYLVNLAQSVVETLLFYHPAVWWVSRRIRQEREHCCDDVALQIRPDPALYAGALLEMEQLRATPARLVAAASGAGLLARVQRLLVSGTAVPRAFPRWMSGGVAIASVVGITGAAHWAIPPRVQPSAHRELPVVAGSVPVEIQASIPPPDAHRELRAGSVPIEAQASAPLPNAHRELAVRAGSVSVEAQSAPEMITASASADAMRRDSVAPTIVVHPDPASALPQRWEWAQSEARRRGLRSFWIGYAIRPLPGVQGTIFCGRLGRGAITGHGVSLQGRLSQLGDFSGFTLPGTPLPSTLGRPDDVGVLLAFEPGAGKRAVLSRVHITSLSLPVDLEDHPLLWLGPSDDAASLELLQRLDRDVPSAEARADLVSAVGVHGTASLVLPILTKRIEASEPDEVRKTAAEWLARHPDPQGLRALTRAARGDRSTEVRREAAEAVGEMRLAEAGDSAVALARTLQDSDARRQAVEALGARPEPRALEALLDIARHDPDPDIQREAVETLGHREDSRSREAVAEIARSHPVSDVRREAVETLGESLPPDQAERILRELLRNEPSPDVHREIVETMGQSLPPERAVPLLGEIVRHGPSVDAQREAVGTLGQLDDVRGMAAVREIARTHPEPEVRREAVETLARSSSPQEAIALLSEISRQDASDEVRRGALEALADLPDGAGIPALIDAARSHPDPDMRHVALEILVDSPDPRARRLFDRALKEHD
jgi:HEAT repeat protein